MSLHDQGARLEVLLRDLLRRLFVFDPEDPASELPVTQLRVLSLLSRSSMTLTRLSDEMGCSVSAASQLADRLEGLVRRVSDPSDRRCRVLELTDRGWDIVRRRTEKRVGRAAEALARLSPEERARALQGLEALLEAARTLPFGAAEEVQP